MANLMNIPELRFPEFKGEWKIMKFGELTERISNPVKVELEKMYQQIGIRSHGKGIFHKEIVDGKTLGNKRVFWVKEDVLIVNIVFAWEQAVAKTSKNDVGMIASHRFPMYLPIKTQSDLNYLLYFFLTKRGKSLLELASPGGAGRNKTLGQKEFEKLKFLIPDVAEQNKIALFLTAIENKLNALKQKKNLLEQYKKGVMQKLFSQELRFKNENGKEFPKWEKKILSELVKIMYGKDQKQIVSENGKYPILGTGGILGRTNQFLYDKPSVLIGRKGTIDKPVYMDTPFWTVDTLFYTEVFSNTFPRWLYYKFQTVNWYLYNEASGVPSLSGSTIYKIQIEAPCFLEQTKIANFLSTIDEKINRVENQIQQTQQYKKGLLQKMSI